MKSDTRGRQMSESQQISLLRGALRIALRAPGIHTTDQKTGKVFSAVIRTALEATAP